MDEKCVFFILDSNNRLWSYNLETQVWDTISGSVSYNGGLEYADGSLFLPKSCLHIYTYGVQRVDIDIENESYTFITSSNQLSPCKSRYGTAVLPNGVLYTLGGDMGFKVNGIYVYKKNIVLK